MSDKELPIDRRNGKPHVGSKQLKAFNPGQACNPKGSPKAALGKKT